MTEYDFDKLIYFSKKEVEATGAKIEDVSFSSLDALDDMRNLLGEPINLIKNGMTTGQHKSDGHPKGVAIDCHMGLYEDYYNVFKVALSVGFNKIGIYWNGSIYSYHLEISDKTSFWTGSKNPGDKNWTYGPLVLDPKDM